jgi:hypothetical protein
MTAKYTAPLRPNSARDGVLLVKVEWRGFSNEYVTWYVMPGDMPAAERALEHANDGSMRWRLYDDQERARLLNRLSDADLAEEIRFTARVVFGRERGRRSRESAQIDDAWRYRSCLRELPVSFDRNGDER